MPQKGRRSADAALLVALACGATIENAAHSAGLSPATAYRRMQDPEFQKDLRKTKSEMVNRAAAMLTAAAGEAIKTMVDLLKDKTPAPTRLGAARAVMEIGLKVRESAEFEQRLAELERRLASSSSAPPPASPQPVVEQVAPDPADPAPDPAPDPTPG